MKNRNILSAVAVIMAISGCAKENVSTPQSSDNTCFSATLESASPDTRTTITDDPEAGYRVTWVKDDTISVNGKKYYAESSGASTKFKVYDQPATGTEFKAYYPSSLVGEGGVTTLPSIQTYGGDGVISNVPTYAVSTTSTLNFKNLCGVLAVKVEKSNIKQIKSLKVSSDQPMCGEFEIANDGGVPYAKLKSSAKDTCITLVSDQLIDIIDEGNTFYLSIPVGTYTNIRIGLSGDGVNFSQTMATKADVNIQIQRNTVYAFSYKVNSLVFAKDIVVNNQL